MPEASVADGTLAFEFQGDWSLQVAAARYQLEAVKHTSIERGLVRAVFTRGGQLAVQALYRMRRRGSDCRWCCRPTYSSIPSRCGSMVARRRWRRGAQDEFFVPLVGRASGEAFLLELRYTIPDSSTKVELPTFRDEPAVQKVFVSLFLPRQWELIGYDGPWTDEQAAPNLFSSMEPRTRHNDGDLLSWVVEGLTLPANPADSFPVDGQSHIFSTLRPDGGDSGSLRLNTFNRQWLQVLIFLAIAGLAVLLLGKSWSQRGAALAALAIVLLVSGVFAPTFAAQLMFGGLWWGLALAFLLWVFWDLYSRKNKSLPIAAAVHPTQTPVRVVSGFDSGGAPHAGDPPPTAGPPTDPPPSDASQQGGEHHE